MLVEGEQVLLLLHFLYDFSSSEPPARQSACWPPIPELLAEEAYLDRVGSNHAIYFRSHHSVA